MSLKLIKSFFVVSLTLFFLEFSFIHIAAAGLVPKLSSLKELDLNSAAQIALADSPTIAAAKERVIQAKQAVIQSRAGYFPWLDANFSYNRTKDPDKIADPANELSDKIEAGMEDLPPEFYDFFPGYMELIEEAADYDAVTTTYTSGLRATLLIFDGLIREFSCAAAKHGVELTKYSLADTRRLLLGAVANVYLGAMLSKESVAISKADEEFNKQLFEETKLLHEAGLRSLSDMLNFEISVNYARTRSLQAQRQYESARFALAALMGLSDARLPAKLKLAPMKAESNEMLNPPDTDEVLEYAMANRPDLLARKTAIDISKSVVGIAKGQYYPHVYLNAAITGTRRDDYSFEGDDYGNSIGVFMTYNLFAGGRHRSRVIESKSQLQETKKYLQEVTKNTVASVRSAVTMVRSAQEQFSLQQTNAELATKTRDLVKKEYLAGKASLTRLNEAQRDLIRIQGFLAQSRVTLRQAWLDMEKESGKILDRFGPF